MTTIKVTFTTNWRNKRQPPGPFSGGRCRTGSCSDCSFSSRSPWSSWWIRGQTMSAKVDARRGGGLRRGILVAIPWDIVWIVRRGLSSQTGRTTSCLMPLACGEFRVPLGVTEFKWAAFRRARRPSASFFYTSQRPKRSSSLSELRPPVTRSNSGNWLPTNSGGGHNWVGGRPGAVQQADAADEAQGGTRTAS